MNTSTKLRLAGIAAALGASALLVGTATGTTGAYFTDSKPGVINAATGGVHVKTSDLTLNFAGLLPGEFQTKTIDYQNMGSGQQDIWLVLPTGQAPWLNGVPGDPNIPGQAPLGRYGHFAVTAPNGSFTSYNLASNRPTDSSAPCSVDQYGRGGSDAQAADTTTIVAYCPVPNAILLSYGLNPTESGTASVTFGYTKLLKGGMDSAWLPIANFKIVATQHGVFPNDPNNP